MKTAVLKVIFFCCICSVLFMTGDAYAATKELRLFASGSMTGIGEADCQLSDAGCTVTNEGIARGTHIGKGTFSQTVTIFWKSGWQAGTDRCAPASGMITVTAADKSTINAVRTGTVCISGDITTFNAAYTITGGTKRFANASGTGVSTCSVDSDGRVIGFANGSLIR